MNVQEAAAKLTSDELAKIKELSSHIIYLSIAGSVSVERATEIVVKVIEKSIPDLMSRK